MLVSVQTFCIEEICCKKEVYILYNMDLEPKRTYFCIQFYLRYNEENRFCELVKSHYLQ